MKTNNVKTLYFEGAGCVSRADVPNCRIRTAFHLDNGNAVYLELSGMETTRNRYNYGDEFKNDCDLLEARQNIDEQIRQKEKARGEKSICYSLWVDRDDPAILHYKNFRTNECFDICVDIPKDPNKMPVLNKSNAFVGAVYAGAGWLQKVYRITEEYAERYELMYLDRCEVSNYGDIALPGSDVYRRKSRPVGVVVPF